MLRITFHRIFNCFFLFYVDDDGEVVKGLPKIHQNYQIEIDLC